MAMSPRSGESAVVDFAAGLFRALGYAKRNRVARTRKGLSLFTCSEFRHAQTDVCIVDLDQNDILLLVQEDKRFEEGEGGDPEAQLIAETIAAFGMNNEQRSKLMWIHLTRRFAIESSFPLSYIVEILSR